jgi:two-component system CheB/CheR fusion protein
MEPGSGEYRIHKSIRDMLIFSEQNLIKDPPFSKLDLISCRNLLIYLGADLQRKIIPLFHYALKPEGFLYLGNSEGVGEFDALFAAMDRKAKIYRRKAGYYGPPPMTTSRYAASQPTGGSLPPAPGKASPGLAPSLRELTERALLQIAPAAALINASGDILYLHGRTGMYLEPAPGAAGVNNILKMAREGLQHGLAAALRKTAASGEFVRDTGLRVKTNGHYSRVNLTVGPVPAIAAPASAAGLFLVLLEESGPEGESHEPHRADEPAAGSDLDARLEAMRLELRFKDELLQSAKEELETSGEELKSSNEEMQSINEELQSTNEELETSKEELQSVNEELATVNAELQNKVTDLSRVNDDMANLLAGTGIATIFINLQLSILRFTPTATEIINLIPGDVGRPVAHIVSNMVGYSNLIPDIREVLRTLVPMSQDVRLQDGRWFSMRILPYRTLENVIEGAVLSFMDISERRLAMEELRKSTPAADVRPDPAGDERPHRLEG